MQELFDNYLHTLPAAMKKHLLQAWQQYQTSALQSHLSIPNNAPFLHLLWLNLAASDYVTHQYAQNPSWPMDFTQEKHQHYNEAFFLKEWQLNAASVVDEASLMRALRRFRHKAICRIVWRELGNQCTLEEHLQELSALADVCVKVATDFIYQQACHQWGTPMNEVGQVQPLIVVALGKLGAQELNLSSDIDLIFTYPEEGSTQGLTRKITNQQFFTKVGQQLIKVLASHTIDGFVYRVDMRLRPHGQSGNLALNFNAIENYYQYHGRDWERYALIKARVITGPPDMGERLLLLLQPFVFRRYLDYGAFESLREMHDLVAADVKRKPIKKNIKQGPGGIRQIEFLAQAFQLIRGGQNRQFQHRQLLVILSRLAQAGYLDKNVSIDLEKAYIFLRKSEHRLQLMQDQQTHELPKNPLDRSRLYFTMGFPSWAEYQAVLKRHTHHVENYFNVISSAPESGMSSHRSEMDLVWVTLKEANSLRYLEKMGYQEAKIIHQLLLNFKESRTCQNLKKHASLRLDKIMPIIILAVAKLNNQETVMTRMLRLMQSIARRSAYLALLLEKPKALDYLIKIASKSEWILGQLCDYPVLLDELLNPPLVYEITDKTYLEKELNQRLNWLLPNDLEGQMDHLRQFKSACYLHLALLELDEKQSNINFSQILNDIAEVIVKKIYELSIDFMIRHYHLPENVDELKNKVPFGIIAYGKFGARELTYQSDLDLVFLYDTYDEQSLQTQDKVISYEEFSLRLAQRIIHMLSTHTTAGTLYEVDVRLRPGGTAGLLVSHFGAFKKYLHEQAWTWEHQALVKARLVVGPPSLVSAFETLRESILTQMRDPILLRKEISKMRQKMHDQHHALKNEIKMAKGGIADIDFIVQYFMLLKAHGYKPLIQHRSSNLILEELQRNQLMDEQDAALLIAALSCYQHHIHHKIFELETIMSTDQQLNFYLERICALWQNIFNTEQVN